MTTIVTVSIFHLHLPPLAITTTLTDCEDYRLQQPYLATAPFRKCLPLRQRLPIIATFTDKLLRQHLHIARKSPDCDNPISRLPCENATTVTTTVATPTYTNFLSHLAFHTQLPKYMEIPALSLFQLLFDDKAVKRSILAYAESRKTEAALCPLYPPHSIKGRGMTFMGVPIWLGIHRARRLGVQQKFGY